MGLIRIIIGLIILGFGFFTWTGTLLQNTPSPDESILSQIPKLYSLEIFLEMIVDSAIIAIGAIILIWGMRACRSPK